MWEKYKFVKWHVLSLLLALIWTISCYAVASFRYEMQLQSLVENKQLLAKNKAHHLKELVSSQLSNVYGISTLLSKDPRVIKLLQRNLRKNSITTPFEKQQLWLKDATLLDTDSTLEMIQGDFLLGHIFILDADGDCIASSLWKNHTSCIGLNFSERKFFKANKEGMKGSQYAMGKTTHKGGLFFATPVQIQGKFLGSVVAKYDTDNFAPLFKSSSAFLLDGNQVIIHSSIPGIQMKTLTANLENKLGKVEINNIYQTNKINQLDISLWEAQNTTRLFRIGGYSDYPSLLSYQRLEQLGLTIVVAEPIKEARDLSRSKTLFFLMLTILGGVLILTFMIGKEFLFKYK